MERESLERMLARGLSLERIGERFGLHPSTVSYWVKKHGLSAAHASRHAPRGGIPRERLEALVRAGGSHHSIARDLGVSTATVRHWLRKFGLETERTRWRRESRAGRAAGRAIIQRKCSIHGMTDFVLHTGGTYRCRRCRRAAVARRRRKVREMIIQEAGGRCATCGYDRYIGALQFHHLDRREKEFGLSGRGITRSLKALREEARKCILLCGNCHAEVEGGVRTVSLQFPGPLKG